MTRVLTFILALLLLSSMALAGDRYFIVVSNNSDETESALAGYPGRCWGKTADKIYLSGRDEEISWLTQYSIDFRAIAFDDDISALYLCYANPNQSLAGRNEVLDSGPGYAVAKSALAGATFCRRLTLRALPFGSSDFRPSAILTYDAVIDSMIGRVSQDTLMDYLGKLSGQTPIEIDDRIDTIRTRYSGTLDNSIAAQYLKQILESYGYQAEYHSFYGGSLRHVSVYNGDRAWAVTEGSEALRTTDGGATWTVMPDNASAALWGVAHAGPDSVWLTGDLGTIRFSSNGGQSFSTQSAGTSYFLFGVCFINSLQGWVAADYGRVSHTINGGSNWTLQTTSTSSRLYDICFVDSLYGWAVGRDGTIVRTTNGGSNWTRQTSNTVERLYGVDFTDRNSGWVVGWNGVVRHTTDGGTNWLTVNLGDNIEKYHVDFADSLHGCVVGWGGEIFMTSDAGQTWMAMSSGTGQDFYGVEFSNTLTGCAVGNGIIEKTTDGGQSWQNQTGGVESAWRNVIATKPGSTEPGQQVIICAHLDDTSEQPPTSAPGADDNGSGTIGVIEAARVFAGRQFQKTVKFCLWTGEEQGLLGSAAYAGDAFARHDTIVGVFNYDMIAWDGNGDFSAELHCGTMTPSIDLGNLVQGVVSDYSLQLNPDLLTYQSTDRSDHASFWDYNYPAMLGIEDFSSDFNPYYHTTNDNMSIIVSDFFTAFVKTAVGGAATLAIPDTSYVSAGHDGQLPIGFALRQNYPNPFNSATSISFTVPARTVIDLSVYDLLGRKVATLYSGPIQTGVHSVTWNAGELASGIYLYRLTAGGHEAVGRMTLLK